MKRISRPASDLGYRVVIPPYQSERLSLRARAARLGALIAFAFFCFVYGFYFAIYFPYLIVQFAAPILVLALLVIWALPDLGRAPAKLLRRLLFAFMLGLICWPDYLALALPGMPWITVIRLVGLPLALVLLISLSISHDFRAHLKNVLNGTPWIWRLLVALIVIQFLSMGLSDEIGSSLDKFIIAQLYWTAIFFASVYVFSRPGQVERWAALLWAAGVFVMLLGVQEARHNSLPWAGHIPGFLKIEDPTVLRTLGGSTRTASGEYRVQSKFTTSLGLAEFTALLLPFVLHFTFARYKPVVKIAGAATIPLLLYVVIKTDSRLAMVGFFLSVLFYIFFWAALRWKRDGQSLIGPAVILAYPAVFGLFIASTFFVRRMRLLVWGGGPESYSTEARKTQVAMGMEIIKKNPFGHGIGRGAETLNFRFPDGTLTIDTYYLLIGLEYGVIGFLIYFGMFLLAIYASGRYAFLSATREHSFLIPLAIALANFVVIKSIFSQTENHPLVFMMLGIVVALVWRIRTELGIGAGPGRLATGQGVPARSSSKAAAHAG